ncbi:hypothetical protein F7Q99_36335 [Streptomyces kaniharaensis]|uniref:Uncharacterized protein n=1 Tax=Streptomyces kaniharaensis TaxID=212423 RepID=A0A6N7L0Z2_9ACTN|nr:hypothetical protein [Streptomyces kaniharaensis]MQS17512.1 hypothetical protein [Streptomyces kaniharaensis]
MPRHSTIGHATMTMSDGRIRCYFIHEQQGDRLLVSPADPDTIALYAAPYPVDRTEFTSITVRATPAALPE